MKKQAIKREDLIILIVLGFLLGVFLVLFFMPEIPHDGSYSDEEIDTKDELLKEYLDEQAYLQSRIVYLREEINEKQNEISSQSDIINLETLAKLKRDIGLTEIRGNGLEIKLDDSPLATRAGVKVTDDLLIQAADIRDVVNVLNAANAEGISINNQRIIATSPISSVGTTILVNNIPVAPPFMISVVGDRDLIVQRLVNNALLNSLYKRSAENNLVVKVTVKEWLTIPVYNGDLKANYLNLIN